MFRSCFRVAVSSGFAVCSLSSCSCCHGCSLLSGGVWLCSSDSSCLSLLLFPPPVSSFQVYLHVLLAFEFSAFGVRVFPEEYLCMLWSPSAPARGPRLPVSLGCSGHSGFFYSAVFCAFVPLFLEEMFHVLLTCLLYSLGLVQCCSDAALPISVFRQFLAFRSDVLCVSCGTCSSRVGIPLSACFTGLMSSSVIFCIAC